VIATSEDGGILETITDAVAIDTLKKKMSSGIVVVGQWLMLPHGKASSCCSCPVLCPERHCPCVAHTRARTHTHTLSHSLSLCHTRTLS